MFKKFRKWLRRPKDPTGNVYYAKLRTLQGDFYKIGYTSKPTLRERMAYGNSGDEKLIEKEFFFTFRKDAWDVEQTLLEHFDKQRAFGKFSNDPKMPLSGRGQSELFAFDVLGLDEDLYKQPDEETVKAIKADLDDAGGGCLLALIGLILSPFTLGLSLFLIAGGLSGIFGQKKVTVLKTKVRPRHPPPIQELINALNRGAGVQAPTATSSIG